MDCKTIGTSPGVTCAPRDTVEQVSRMMREDNTGFVTVVDGDHRAVGVVTDRDIVVRVVAASMPGAIAIEQAMTHDPVTISVDKDSVDAARHMAQRGCRRLPIVDDAGKVVGVVTFDDLLLASRSHSRRADAVGRGRARRGAVAPAVGLSDGDDPARIRNPAGAFAAAVRPHAVNR